MGVSPVLMVSRNGRQANDLGTGAAIAGTSSIGERKIRIAVRLRGDR
jgi:hypothetical protein